VDALTSKQEHFARLVAEGNSQSDAYRDAYNSSGKIDSVNVNASKLMADAKIALRVAQLKQDLAEKSLWTRLDSVKVLSDIAKGEDPDAKPADRVNATKALNLMHGWDKITIENTHRVIDDGSHEW
jgi:hypothetical protein